MGLAAEVPDLVRRLPTHPAERVGDPQRHLHRGVLEPDPWGRSGTRRMLQTVHLPPRRRRCRLRRRWNWGCLGGRRWATPPWRVPMRRSPVSLEGFIQRFSTRRAAVLATYERLEAEWWAITDAPRRGSSAPGRRTKPPPRSRSRRAGGDVVPRDSAGWLDRRRVGRSVTSPPGMSKVMMAAACRLGRWSWRGAGELHEQRAWWTRAHVTAGAARLIADPTPETIEVGTERIIAMCISLEADDHPEVHLLGAAKYTTIRTAEERVRPAFRLRGPGDVSRLRWSGPGAR